MITVGQNVKAQYDFEISDAESIPINSVIGDILARQEESKLLMTLCRMEENELLSQSCLIS